MSTISLNYIANEKKMFEEHICREFPFPLDGQWIKNIWIFNNHEVNTLWTGWMAAKASLLEGLYSDTK